MSEFIFFESIPLFILGLSFTIVFAVFIVAALILLFSRSSQGIETAGKLLTKSLYGFLAILVISSISLAVSALLRPEAPKSSGGSDEFPSSPFSAALPPAPQFIKVNGFYFNGPLLLKDNDDIIDKSAIFLILCKNNEEYDIIYIEETISGIKFSKHEEATCWKENCSSNDLYLAVFWTPREKYSSSRRQEITNLLKEKNNPLCPQEE